MILNSITIENIRSYYHEEVIFPRGISLFEGDIGSGKSTVLMAIEFALFGLGSQKAESLLAKKAESGFVILDFSVDGEKYEIKRTLKRKKSGVNQDPKNSWIRIDGEVLPLSPSELKQKVLEILGFNEPVDPKAESKIFRYAIFTPQEAMKEVLSDSGKRLETIRKAFGIEDYSIAKSNALEVFQELRAKGAVLQERFSNISELELEIEKANKKIAELDENIVRVSKTIEKKNAEKKEIILKIKELQEKNNERIRIESKIDSLKESIASAKNQFSQIEDDLAEFEKELIHNNQRMDKLVEIKRSETELTAIEIGVEIKKFQKISDKLIGLKSEKNSISGDISKLKESLGEKINADKNSLESRLRELEKEKESLESSLKEITEKNNKIKSEQVEKKTLKSSLEKEINEFTKLGNNCPTCKQEITEDHHHTLVDEKQKMVEKLNQEIKEITDSFFESDSKTKETKEKIESYQTEIVQIQQILPGIEEFASKTSKLLEIETEIKEIECVKDSKFGAEPIEFLTNLKDELMEFENAAEQKKQILESRKNIESKISQKQSGLERLEKEISEKQRELVNTEKLLESFEDAGELISKLELKQNGYIQEINQMSGILATSKERKNNEQTSIKTNENKISESKKWQKKFNIISEIKEWLEKFFIPTISQIEKQVLLSILHNFNETYTRWYSILVEDPTKESRIDENFTPIVNQDGFEQEVNYLSGGEKTSIALAYRLTLNSLMRKETESMKSNLLILDEPTDGFSKNQLGKIRELLDELKSQQIVLVSHEKELETYVDNIFHISKQDGISKISRMN